MPWLLRNQEGFAGARPPHHAEPEEVWHWRRGSASSRTRCRAALAWLCRRDPLLLSKQLGLCGQGVHQQPKLPRTRFSASNPPRAWWDREGEQGWAALTANRGEELNAWLGVGARRCPLSSRGIGSGFQHPVQRRVGEVHPPEPSSLSHEHPPPSYPYTWSYLTCFLGLHTFRKMGAARIAEHPGQKGGSTTACCGWAARKPWLHDLPRFAVKLAGEGWPPPAALLAVTGCAFRNAGSCLGKCLCCCWQPCLLAPAPLCALPGVGRGWRGCLG